MQAPHSYTEPVFIISVASDILGIHPQTLRFYEREELVIPQRTEAGQRLYSQKDLDDVREIRVLTRERGVNLAGVKIILEMRAHAAQLQEENQALRRRLAERGDSA
jgi:MerR family transcriptional regulator/heat shock protein HspR